MNVLKGMGDFFALDIGTNAIRVVQLKKTGSGWALEHYGYAPIDSKLTSSDSEEARRAGQKGGEAVSRNREHMAEIGRKGGESRQSAQRANESRSSTAARSGSTEQASKTSRQGDKDEEDKG